MNFKNAIWTSGHFRRTIKFCFKLGKKCHRNVWNASDYFCINQASVFEWHRRFKEGRKFVRDDERCGRNKEVNRPELIGQRLRGRVTMMSF